jgi:hypothetical protein
MAEKHTKTEKQMMYLLSLRNKPVDMSEELWEVVKRDDVRRYFARTCGVAFVPFSELVGGEQESTPPNA